MHSFQFTMVAAILALPQIAAAVDQSEYANPELLIEPTALQAIIAGGDKDLVVLHAAADRLYERAHVPGAVEIDVPAWKAAFGEGDDSEGWSKRIGRVGIGPDTHVVVYDEGGATSAARVWWILKYWGVENAAILNGGLRGWVEHVGGETKVDERVKPEPQTFTATPHPERLRTTEQMRQVADKGDARIIDTRSGRELLETGKIGAAERCEWGTLIDEETGRFKSAEELNALLGLETSSKSSQETVTYCRSGGRASVVAFALELMGEQNVANYYGSWNAWEQREDRPKDPN